MMLSKLFPILFVSFLAGSFLNAQENALLPVSGNTMVTVGDPGNAAHKLRSRMTLGAVDHSYQIGMYEQTVQDWCDLLTAVASHPNHPNNKIYPDPHHLWNEGMTPWITRTEKDDGTFVYNVVEGKGLLPITHVNFYSILRCSNWHEQGAPILEDGADTDAITEHGAYEFAANGITFTANLTAHFTIPSQDEWIKAAYYKGNGLSAGYWNYPTQSNNNPGNNNGDVTNQANYNSRSWLSSPLLALSPVNFFSDTQSFYGCRDMGGNVNEWTATQDPAGYIARGGSYQSQYNYLGSNDLIITATPQGYGPDTESALIGFRIAYHDSLSAGVVSSETQEGTIQADTSSQNGLQSSSGGSSRTGLTTTDKVLIGVGGVVAIGLACWFYPPAAVAEIQELGEVAGTEEGAVVGQQVTPRPIDFSPNTKKLYNEIETEFSPGPLVPLPVERNLDSAFRAVEFPSSFTLNPSILEHIS